MVTNVVWVSYHAQGDPPIIPRGYWDQGLLEDLLAGRAWRLQRGRSFRHWLNFHIGGDHVASVTGDGAIVVVPARWHTAPEDIARLNADLAPLPWVLLILTGDEEGAFPRQQVDHPNMLVWVQTPRPSTVGLDDRETVYFGCGYPPWLPALLDGHGSETRPNGWFFGGQVNNSHREQCRSVLAARAMWVGDGKAAISEGFTQGLPPEDYVAEMMAAKVHPAPSGCYTPDTFRVWESLESGGLPIVDAAALPDEPGYWRQVIGPGPWRVLDNWRDGALMIAGALADWPGNANQAFAWWQRYKGNLAHRLEEDLVDLGTIALALLAEPEPDDLITVLVSTSPVPANPSTDHLEETIASVRAQLPTAEIVLMFDGPAEGDNAATYGEFTRRALWAANRRWHNVIPLVSTTHRHQAGMTRWALDHIRTPLMLFVEHDTPLVGQIPWQGMCAAIGHGDANVIRLHHETSILEPHRHLMLDNKPTIVAGVALTRTVQWSQRPHLAATEFYRRVMPLYFGAEARTFIEDVLHGVLDVHARELGEAGWAEFRLWLYTPPGDIKRSTHIDARGHARKTPMIWAYDGPTPWGAPTPTAERHEAARPRLGLLAWASNRGLGIQTWELARHLQPSRILVVRMDESPHTDLLERFPGARVAVADPHRGQLPEDDMRWLCSDTDVVLAAETPYDFRLWDIAREMGVRTVCQINPEFYRHTQEPTLPRPDLLLNPSTWRGDRIAATYLPCPVDRTRLPFALRTAARRFLHVIGRPAALDRQGTEIVLEAATLTEHPIDLTLRMQTGTLTPWSEHWLRHLEAMGRPAKVVTADIPNYWDLYAGHDVLLAPRRFGGQSLPLQEAASAGLAILAADREPERSMLHPQALAAIKLTQRANCQGGQLPVEIADPRSFAERIDALMGDPALVEALSWHSDALAESLSWDTLLPRWRQVLGELAAKETVG
jgi:glycosyltransferase involved in cell wall biosynthesis